MGVFIERLISIPLIARIELQHEVGQLSWPQVWQQLVIELNRSRSRLVTTSRSLLKDN